MVLRRVSQSDLRWGCNGSTTTPSASPSPLVSSASLSPLPTRNLSVNSLLNTGASSDEASHTRDPSPHSPLSKVPYGGDSQPEVRQQLAVTLPGFDQLRRVADGGSGALTPPATPGASSVAMATAPVGSQAPVHTQQHQLPIRHALPPQLHHFHGQHRPGFHPSRGAVPRIQKKPRRPASYPAGHTRNNRKYTAEQVDFICYYHVDKKYNWNDVTRLYKAQFRSEESRTPSGLQGSYYRGNLQLPVTDHNNDLVFSADGTLKVRTVKVRDQAGNKIGLLDRYPDRAIEYPWVLEEDKRRVWHLGRRHQEQLARAHRNRQASLQSPFLGSLAHSLSPPSSISSLSTTSPRI